MNIVGYAFIQSVLKTGESVGTRKLNAGRKGRSAKRPFCIVNGDGVWTSGNPYVMSENEHCTKRFGKLQNIIHVRPFINYAALSKAENFSRKEKGSGHQEPASLLNSTC